MLFLFFVLILNSLDDGKKDAAKRALADADKRRLELDEKV
jgi:hypothetical protein